ncbi:hypothetical protein ACRRTK_010147 [Alexandromys fortis]
MSFLIQPSPTASASRAMLKFHHRWSWADITAQQGPCMVHVLLDSSPFSPVTAS